MSKQNIMGALEAHMDLLNIVTQYENEIADPKGQEYVKCFHLFGSTDQLTLGRDGKDETSGIFQIDIYMPLDKGRSENIDVIEKHFDMGSDLHLNDTTVRIRETSLGPGRKDDAYYIYPLSIRWDVYRNVGERRGQ